MYQVFEIAYIVTIMIGVAALATQYMAASKNLDVSNQLVKGKNTTVLLTIILIFSFMDLLIVFLNKTVDESTIAWFFVFENVLEVALAYAIIVVERDYVEGERVRWLSPFFLAIASVILWIDVMYTTEIMNIPEQTYAIIMIVLNLCPLIVATYFCVKYTTIIVKTKGALASEIYVGILSAAFLFLCLSATASIIDARTEYDYLKWDRTVFLIFWIILNIVNLSFVWQSCDVSAASKKAIEEDIESRVDELGKQFELSQREKEIALLLYKGKNNTEIAETLYLSTNTVKVHASNLYKKLGVNNRIQAVKRIRGDNIEE